MSIEETTSGIDEARKAVRAANLSSRQADNLIKSARGDLNELRELREANHFADKFRAVIRGAL